jgi:hypothetical protein
MPRSHLWEGRKPKAARRLAMPKPGLAKRIPAALFRASVDATHATQGEAQHTATTHGMLALMNCAIDTKIACGNLHTREGEGTTRAALVKATRHLCTRAFQLEKKLSRSQGELLITDASANTMFYALGSLVARGLTDTGTPTKHEVSYNEGETMPVITLTSDSGQAVITMNLLPANALCVKFKDAGNDNIILTCGLLDDSLGSSICKLDTATDKDSLKGLRSDWAQSVLSSIAFTFKEFLCLFNKPSSKTILFDASHESTGPGVMTLSVSPDIDTMFNGTKGGSQCSPKLPHNCPLFYALMSGACFELFCASMQ